jgi:hypothetical protein
MRPLPDYPPYRKPRPLLARRWLAAASVLVLLSGGFTDYSRLQVTKWSRLPKEYSVYWY